VVIALGATYLSFVALLGPANAVPMQFLAGRAAAAGLAAMNTITMFSGFLGPYWMGLMKDATGTYQAGLRGLVLPALAGAGVMFVLTRSLRKPATLRLADATEVAN
jgi:ACS family tartrate transporter-like MFS transporter